jgi:NADH-quinone oxidoreductase subunit C
LSSADTETPPTDEAVEDEATETDAVREALLERIQALLGDDLVQSHITPGHDLIIRVTAESWKRTHKLLRDELGFKFFEFVSAIDWMPSPFGKSEDSSVDVGELVTTLAEPGEIVTGLAGGDTRFQVFSRLVDITRHSLGVTIKADVPDPREADEPAVESIIGVFPGANWHEREAHEMFGIRFAGHPYLVNLYLPTGFEGNPLRKDFPLLARHVKPWPGIVDVEPMPDEAADDESEGDES